MKRLLFMLMVALPMSVSAAAQDKPELPSQAAPNQFWEMSGDTARLVRPGIAFPRRAGTTSLSRSLEFSRQGQGLDNGLQYQTRDGSVFATAYIYFPALPHAGLTAIATDQALRTQSSTSLSGGEARTVAAGGVPGVAIRRDYGGYRGNLASSAAFIKVDRWIVKLRVSGPQDRSNEVFAVMDDLLAGIRFDAAQLPRPAAPIALVDCSGGAGGRAARLLPDPVAAELTATALMATLDGGGEAGSDSAGRQRTLPSRIPPSLCVSQRARIGNNTIPILRAAEGQRQAVEGRSLLVAFLNDAGGQLEVIHVENQRRYWLLRHDIGETILLGSYDAVPSDQQLLALLTGPRSDHSRIRARVGLTPDGNHQVSLPPAEPARSQPTT